MCLSGSVFTFLILFFGKKFYKFVELINAVVSGLYVLKQQVAKIMHLS